MRKNWKKGMWGVVGMNKKGILPTFVLLFTLACVTAAFFHFSNASENREGYVGEPQLGMIEVLFESKNDLIYDKQVIEQSFGDLVVEFAENGIIHNGDKTSDGYTYWYRGGIKCYPDINSLENNFIRLLNGKLKSDGRGNYNSDLIFEGNSIILNLKSNKEYLSGGDDYSISYISGSEISSKYNYDFNSFLEGVDEVQEIVLNCGADSGCWDMLADFYFEEHNNLFKLEITSPNVTDVFGEKEVILKAAVDFNEINALLGEDFKCLD